jgi:hypothetical protein
VIFCRQVFLWCFIAFLAAGLSPAQEKSNAKGKPTPAPVKKATVVPETPPQRVLERFLVLPEPKVMRSARSKFLPEARTTVITAALETADAPGIRAYTPEEFAVLGISLDSFIERARAAANRRLAALQPDYVRDESGKILYAVYRGDSPLMASLLVAPSLGRIFRNIFGDEIWVMCPDRHALFVFPAKAADVAEFTTDLRERYESDAYAASSEIFLLKGDGAMPQVVGNFSN